jgi:phytoene desaturase
VSDPRVVIIGGGLAGLSSGIYARRNGFRSTIVEHHSSLGGVCTTWDRGPYRIDGCIHWLTGGPFSRIYTELGVLPAVPVRVIEHFATYRDRAHGFEIPITRDLDSLAKVLSELCPSDSVELSRMVDGARRVANMQASVDKPEELMTPRDGLAMFWQMRHDLPALAHFRKSFRAYAEEHLKGELVRRVFSNLVPAEAPAFFLLMMLGYLERGYLSRPVGGTAPFRDALVESYRRLGGEVQLGRTVEEILVEGDRARGVRLSDGTMLEADAVISTSSGPETVLTLLGGRYGAEETRQRLETWKLFDPIVLVSFGVANAFSYAPSTLIVDHVEPFYVGGRHNDGLYVRVYNDEPSVAPAGHTVVQAMLPTHYDWWASRGTEHDHDTKAVAELVLTRLEPHLPGIQQAVELVDVATPLTYWNTARSWRGAYEGWIPSPEAFFGHISKKLPGLSGLYMAGQWVEPGGGVPTAVTSGRKAVQLLCADREREFVANSR